MRVHKVERNGDGKLRLNFRYRATRNRYKASKFRRTNPAVTLSDVGWNRDCGASKLRGQPKLFFGWKRSSHAVNLDYCLHSELPSS